MPNTSRSATRNIRPVNTDTVHVETYGVVLCDTVITGAVHQVNGEAVTCPSCLETMALAREATT